MTFDLAMPLAVTTGRGQVAEWAVLGLLFLIALGFAIGNVVVSHLLGPKRKGAVKDNPYESGVNPIGDTRRRFNVRFYLVAMIFLVFEVEVLFLLPWITTLPLYQELGMPAIMPYGTFFAIGVVFIAVIILGFIYDWGKGVLEWD